MSFVSPQLAKFRYECDVDAQSLVKLAPTDFLTFFQQYV